MLRGVLLFFTALLLSLTAGRAFWIWLGENPFNMSGATYVEFFQQLDQRVAVPIAGTGIGGTLLAGLSANARAQTVRNQSSDISVGSVSFTCRPFSLPCLRQ